MAGGAQSLFCLTSTSSKGIFSLPWIPFIYIYLIFFLAITSWFKNASDISWFNVSNHFKQETESQAIISPLTLINNTAESFPAEKTAMPFTQVQSLSNHFSKPAWETSTSYHYTNIELELWSSADICRCLQIIPETWYYHRHLFHFSQSELSIATL